MRRAGDTPVPATTRVRATRAAAETARAHAARALSAAAAPRDAGHAARPPRDGTGVAVIVPDRWTDHPHDST